jgi:hypothetical protein
MCAHYENIKSKARMHTYFGAEIATEIGMADVWPGSHSK